MSKEQGTLKHEVGLVGNPTGGGVRNTCRSRSQAATLSFPQGRSGPRALHALLTTF